MDNTKALLIEVHELINQYSQEVNKSLKATSETIAWDEFRLNNEEKKALKDLNLSEDSFNAIRKIVSDNMLKSYHDFFAIIDAVGDPEVIKSKEVWLGFKLQERTCEDDDSDLFLHDLLYDTFWDWIENKKPNNAPE